MRPLSLLRRPVGAALSATAKTLSFASNLTETLATGLRSPAESRSPKREDRDGGAVARAVRPLRETAESVGDAVERGVTAVDEAVSGAADRTDEAATGVGRKRRGSTSGSAPIETPGGRGGAPRTPGRVVERAPRGGDQPFETEVVHQRTSESHVAELAERGANALVPLIRDQLSTDELESLYEHESLHRKRKTVLKAIEEALRPPVTSEQVETDLLADLELIESAAPDSELVYSSETPADTSAPGNTIRLPEVAQVTAPGSKPPRPEMTPGGAGPGRNTRSSRR